VKAIIPVGGLGTRLRPHTLTTPKVLLHVAGKPILAHVLDELIAAGIGEVVLVTGYLGEQIQEWVRANYDIPSAFVEQREPLGNGHAVYVARHHLDGAPVLVLFGDTIIRTHLPELLARSESSACVKEVPDPRRFGVAEVDAGGYITRLVEKPEHPASNLALVGCYLIRRSAALADALVRMVQEERQVRGEYWLADAMQLMIDAGERLRTFPINHWYDCGTVEALLVANRELLDLSPPAAPTIPGVVVHEPVAVDPAARISDSVIGPHASVGAGAVIRGAVVRDAIVHPGALIDRAVVSGAVIGEGARIAGS
jgi:glucose-1-phosphate thymidylyltransferase